MIKPMRLIMPLSLQPGQIFPKDPVFLIYEPSNVKAILLYRAVPSLVFEEAV